MAISILNNIASLTAQNQLSNTSFNLNKTLGQLSSGSRINSGADDAAGLAIADGLHANVTALTQSAQNANAGVGSLQVADGALAQVTTLLNRAVTLATEASNGSVSNAQRTAVQAEYAQINSEISSIGSTTNYNGAGVFSATAQNTFLSDGVSPTTIGVTTGVLSAATLGLVAGAVTKTTPATSATNTINITGLPSDGEILTIAGTAYTFKTALTASTTAGQVLIGASAATAATNLAAAITGGAGSGVGYGSLTVTNANTSASATGGTVTLTAIAAGTGGNAFTAVESGTASGNVAVTSLNFSGGAIAVTTNPNVNNTLTTAADAQDTLTLINSAIASVASLRGTLGANVNRLQAASAVITNEVQNLTSAEDGIRAADIPNVVASLSRFTILNQSGISALAQANTAQQSILTLLR